MPPLDDLAPAMTTAVLRRGVLLRATGYGTGIPETIYQTASLGKHFTAAVAILLAASGEMRGLDYPVGELLPEVADDWHDVSMRHLLSHTAGIPSAGYDSLDYSRDYTDSEIVQAIASGGSLDFSPGTAWRYSNAGYVLAGIAIGRGAGAFYGDLLRDRIFAPLGMTTATVNTPQAPVGYHRSNGRWEPAQFVSPTLNRLADGGISLSVLDLARWEAALCGDWGALLSEMFQETVLRNGSPCGYGLGWSLSRSDYGRVAEHDGGWQGFSTAMVRYLDEGTAAIVMCNAEDVDAAALAHSLARAEALSASG